MSCVDDYYGMGIAYFEFDFFVIGHWATFGLFLTGHWDSFVTQNWQPWYGFVKKKKNL